LFGALGIIGYSSMKIAAGFFPFYGAAFYLGLRRPNEFWKCFFFLLPLVGWLNVVLKISGMSLYFPFFLSGVLGLSLSHREK
jgi:hypothetical protein